jgi:formylglycine-generating enzyme required for sulfatase activity
MGWPLSQDYNEAIQSPGRNFADLDLKGGEVVSNSFGLPMPYSGNFADVYQVRSSDGSRWAVKCFTREVPGLRERYREISRHLRQARLPFTVDFSYLEEGIRVTGRWFPVLKMQWVEGLTLNQFVAQHAEKPTHLEALLQIWGRLARRLREAEVAHCDLQHGNVLLVPGSGPKSLALKLVDYDGMWVPALTRSRSGEVGHPSYQHPQRAREQTYSREVDRFSLLLIATALRAVTVKGRALWDKYDNGDNLLFNEPDLAGPTKSFLFLDLIRSADPLTEALADHLLKSLRGGVESAPLLEEVLPDVSSSVSSIRPAKPVAILVGGNGTATGVVARPVVRRKPTKRSGVRVATWVAVVAMLLGGLGLIGALFAVMRQHPDRSATEAAVAHNRSEDSQAEEPRSGQVRVEDMEPRKEETDPIKPTEQEKPKLPPPDTHRASEKPQTPPKETPREKPEKPKKEEPEKPDKPRPPPKVEDSLPNPPIGMKFAGIREGDLLMGSPDGEVGRKKNEGPQHKVRITSPFYMSIFPVTKGQFARFAKEAPYKTEAEQARDKLTWQNTGFSQDNPHEPVVFVTWNDAVKFCEWLTKEDKEGRRYVLPTEAQWEYACRVGTKTAYFFGDDAKFLKDYAWYKDNSENRIHPVAGQSSNPKGLFDLYGNVRQWCRDDLRTYAGGEVVDPIGPETAGGQRALRGGDWESDAAACRSAARMHLDPSERNNHVGFRVVCEP